MFPLFSASCLPPCLILLHAVSFLPVRHCRNQHWGSEFRVIHRSSESRFRMSRKEPYIRFCSMERGFWLVDWDLKLHNYCGSSEILLTTLFQSVGYLRMAFCDDSAEEL